MNKKKNSRGFTLIELLVVIAIIGILAVVAVPALFKNINKSKIAKLETSYNAVKSATLSYYADKSELPNNLKDLVDNGYIEGSIDDANMQAQTGGIYKLYIKNNDGKIVDASSKSIEVHTIDNSGKIEANKIKLEEKGSLFLAIQGHEGIKKSMFINDEGIKKLCNDIGNENIYIYENSIGSTFKNNELYLRVIENY